MRGWARCTGAAAVLLAAAALALPRTLIGPAAPSAVGVADRLRMVPDYAGVTVPPNIAPLNFRIDEPGRRYRAHFAAPAAEPLMVENRTGEISISPADWRALVKAARGSKIELQASVLLEDGRWRECPAAEIYVAEDPIDPYVVYRLMNPVYRIVAQIDIRQRSLESFEETTLVSTESFGGCVNCHTFPLNDPDRMVLHMRSGTRNYGAGMLMVEPDRIHKISTSTPRLPGLAAFTSWHPSRRLVAFSVNNVAQFFHAARNEVRDVYDLKSDLAVYDFESGRVTSCAAITRSDRLETFPCWAPDGRHLYYSSAPVLWEGEADDVSIDRYAEVRYRLERVPYEPATGEWGRPEVVLDAEALGKSVTQPRISPDGRFLVTCMSDYSTFPSFQPSADLYLTDLASGETRRMECSSERSESWHSWSSNSRWLAFSSKRADGQFIRVYFAHVDQNGRSGKPFALPQESPAFYDSFIRLHQLPELVRGPVRAGRDRVAAAIRTGEWQGVTRPATGATPLVPPEPGRMPEPWSSAHR